MYLKIVRKLLAVLALVSGTAFAQQPATCSPYQIPVQETVTDCGPGLMGSKFKTMTKACPSGVVTESADFDTTGCVAAPTGTNGFVSAATRCRLTPDACANTPIAAACPTGSHWTTTGSNIAHCVQDDPSCPWGTSLTHDWLGNPSCVANTCPSNQVLQADGKSCGCSSGLVWNGASCVAPTPTCYAGTATTATAACPYGGTRYYRETTSCPAGAFGAPSISGTWDDSGCAPRPVTCSSSSYTETATCGSGIGTQYRAVTTSCPGGSYGSPSTSYGSWDTSSCVAACTPSSSTISSACGTGFSGTKYTTTTYSCPSGSTSTTDTSGCGCANGATDYPTCTVVQAAPPTPPPFSCQSWVYGTWTSGSYTYCWEGNDALVKGSSLDLICKGQGVLEVTRNNSVTGVTQSGYTCTFGASSMYSYSGKRFTN